MQDTGRRLHATSDMELQIICAVDDGRLRYHVREFRHNESNTALTK